VIAERASLAAELMEGFAESTGLTGGGPSRRYLWTDAFAVCTFLGLRREVGGPRWLELALRLVDQVHRTLGRHRPDDARCGWLSGLDEEAGSAHPTSGGLRIGKELPERGPEESRDAQLEWDRDGQYLHYLTRWIHALHRVAGESGEASYDRWAVELATRAHAAFTYRVEGGPMRMAWKMSIDLSRPLVGSMGHHDPLDALVTYLELRAGAPAAVLETAGTLSREIDEAAALCAGRDWATEDPLGIGGLLTDAALLARVGSVGGRAADELLRVVLGDAIRSLGAFEGSDLLRMPPERRLAFRELGLAIGLHAVERSRDAFASEPTLASAAEAILAHLPLAAEIERTWSAKGARQTRAWWSHRDIDTVMLATSLAPEGYLGA
jgi:hypothetical protein